MKRKFEGKRALVTGSAKRMGKAIALFLAENGASVAINYLMSKKEAEQTAKEARKFGVKSFAVQADVTDPAQAKELVERVALEFGGIDYLVCNVGSFANKNIRQLTAKDWMDDLQTNLNHAFFCCKAALPFMEKQGFGRIVNIGYTGADRIHAKTRPTAYQVAKNGVITLTKSFALEYAKSRVTVNCVSPGIMFNTKSRKTRQGLEKLVPMGRLATFKDVLRAFDFFLSDDADYVTGQNLEVAGGYQL
ncbi:MAG: SDR family oxidoreductase [Candidatus Diapherotrites archaeon]|nr:SDR family oxidoreductase [Candidatus Diapherotrites archaeon]